MKQVYGTKGFKRHQQKRCFQYLCLSCCVWMNGLFFSFLVFSCFVLMICFWALPHLRMYQFFRLGFLSCPDCHGWDVEEWEKEWGSRVYHLPAINNEYERCICLRRIPYMLYFTQLCYLNCLSYLIREAWEISHYFAIYLRLQKWLTLSLIIAGKM